MPCFGWWGRSSVTDPRLVQLCSIAHFSSSSSSSSSSCSFLSTITLTHARCEVHTLSSHRQKKASQTAGTTSPGQKVNVNNKANARLLLFPSLSLLSTTQHVHTGCNIFSTHFCFFFFQPLYCWYSHLASRFFSSFFPPATRNSTSDDDKANARHAHRARWEQGEWRKMQLLALAYTHWRDLHEKANVFSVKRVWRKDDEIASSLEAQSYYWPHHRSFSIFLSSFFIPPLLLLLLLLLSSFIPACASSCALKKYYQHPVAKLSLASRVFTWTKCHLCDAARCIFINLAWVW